MSEPHLSDSGSHWFWNSLQQ